MVGRVLPLVGWGGGRGGPCTSRSSLAPALQRDALGHCCCVGNRITVAACCTQRSLPHHNNTNTRAQKRNARHACTHNLALQPSRRYGKASSAPAPKPAPASRKGSLGLGAKEEESVPLRSGSSQDFNVVVTASSAQHGYSKA